MRFHTGVLMLVTMSVALAGCFGGSGSETGVERDCGNKNHDLFITQTDDASWPLYELNDGGTQSVVAMGFQEGGDTVAGDISQGESGLVVPNPPIVVMECQTLTLTIHNNNPLAHTFHLHGGLQDWTMDGVPYLSQLPIHAGETFTYVFEDMAAGTYWYHCHVDVAHHIDLGMYGAFIVQEWEPEYEEDVDMFLMLDEWDNCHVHGSPNVDPRQQGDREDGQYPVGDADCQGRKFQDYYGQNAFTQTARDPLCDEDTTPQEIKDALGCGHGNAPAYRESRGWYYTDFPPYTPVYNTFTINGKSFPDTSPIFFEEGQTIRIRLINVGEEWHSMHLHGHNFLIAYRDAYKIESPQRADTIAIGPGERFDIIVEADNPGFWAFHDHVGVNVANDYQAPGGMFTVIAYTGDFATSVGFEPEPGMRAIEVMDFTKAYHEEHGGGHGHGEAGTPVKSYVGTNGVLKGLTY